VFARRRIAAVKNAAVLRVWKTPFSGRKEIRKDIEEMLEFIKNSSVKVDYIIFRDIDRLTRAGSEFYKAIKKSFVALGVELVDSYGLIQPNVNTLGHLGVQYSWSEYSPSEMAETMKADISKDEVRTILTRMIGAEIQLVREGYHIGSPLEGCLNHRIYVEGKKRCILIPDPARSKYYIEMFNLRATGMFSDQEIVDKINASGFASKVRNKWDRGHTKIIGQVGGKPLTIKGFQRIILKTEYCGVISHAWTNHLPVKAKYEGLVSIDTFNRANGGRIFIQQNNDGTLQMLYDYYPDKVIVKRSKANPLFPFKCILCPLCRKPFHGSAPRGKSGKGFPTYPCARKHKYLGINKQTFDTAIENYVKNIKFSAAFFNTLQAVLIDTFRRRQKEVVQASVDINQNVTNLEIEKNQAVEAYISSTSALVKQEIEKKIETLEARIIQARQVRTKVEVTEDQLTEFLSYAKKLMEHPADLLICRENILKQQAMFGLLFEGMQKK
jgi:DNA invertase Pin-like site-specific DNA recombinase